MNFVITGLMKALSGVLASALQIDRASVEQRMLQLASVSMAGTAKRQVLEDIVTAGLQGAKKLAGQLLVVLVLNIAFSKGWLIEKDGKIVLGTVR